MPIEQPHPSDQSLLQHADGELSRQRAAAVRRHLAACWDCRARMSAIESTIANFVQATHRSLDSEVPPTDGPRALLKARLANEAVQSHPRSWWRLRNAFGAASSKRTLAYSTALSLMLLLVGRAAYVRATRDPSAMSHRDAMLPDRTLTPGAARPVAVAEICASNHDDVDLPVSASVEQAVFKEYGIRGVPAGDYEVDHLITPGLGGTDDIRNLWPEPRYDTAWNSYVKDELEDYLHQSVCRGDINLEAAQHDVSTDWISAYKKYFRTDVPLGHITSTDSPGAPSEPRLFALDFRLGL